MADSPVPKPARRRKWLLRRIPLLVIIVLLLIGAAVVGDWAGVFRSSVGRSWNGPSDKLSSTLIVPTLDTPIATGKNVIWCSSFQVAWNHLKNDIIKEPVQLANAQLIADRLNNAKESEADLPADSYYAAAGWVKDGIIETIQKEMAKRFPDAPTPTFDSPLKEAVAYAYLAADILFDPPFIDNPKKLDFKPSTGETGAVRSFGIPPRTHGQGHRLRDRVTILYAFAAPRRGGEDEFVIDPCNDSRPNQIVLASVAPKATVAETLSDVEAKVAQWKPGPEYEYSHVETLLIPNSSFRIHHHFSEIEGEDKRFLNKTGERLWLSEAFQMIDFKLRRTGVSLKSEAKIIATQAAPSERVITDFVFDRPFLLYMKKRGAERPFFVMWVDNPELLTKW